MPSRLTELFRAAQLPARIMSPVPAEFVVAARAAAASRADAVVAAGGGGAGSSGGPAPARTAAPPGGPPVRAAQHFARELRIPPALPSPGRRPPQRPRPRGG